MRFNGRVLEKRSNRRDPFTVTSPSGGLAEPIVRFFLIFPVISFFMHMAATEAFSGPMYMKEGAHFLIRFEGRENRGAGHIVALVLEEAYFKVGADLAYWPEKRIEAVLYADKEFYDITRSQSWIGAIFDGKIKMPVGGVEVKTVELERVIIHEYTHAMVHSLSGGRAPVWLHEGLAQYEEGKDAGRYRDYLKGLAGGEGGEDLSLRRLEGSFTGLGREEASRAYLLSLSAVQYIVNEFGLNSVKRILTGLRDGLGIDGALRAAIYLSYEDLEKSWLDNMAS